MAARAPARGGEKNVWRSCRSATPALKTVCRRTNEAGSKQLKPLIKHPRPTGPKSDKAFLAFVINETKDAMEDVRDAPVEAKSRKSASSPAVR
jgi:hypothetical protein